jgi:type III secretion protein SpaR/YscT/HrcT
MVPYEQSAAVVLAVAVLMARIGAALAVFPMFALGTLPLSVRASIVAGLALCLLPALGVPNLMALGRLDGNTLALLLVKEVALGFALGFAGSAAFWAVQAAGAVIENQAGLTMAQTIDPLSAQEDSLVGGFLVQVLTILFLVSGGLLTLLGVLYESFRVWPVSELAPRLDAALWLQAAGQAARFVAELALRVAAPFVLLMLLVEVALGLFGRYARQFDVFFLALPLKTALLLVLLMLYLALAVDGTLLPDVAAPMRSLFGGR